MKKPPSLQRWSHKSLRLLCILGFACFYTVGLVAFTPQAFAASLDRPGGSVSDASIRRVDIAQPAVVRIITKIDGTLDVRFTAGAAAVTFPIGGGNYPLEFSGTGSFISPHGDLLTADHVVNPPHDQSLNDALYEISAPDIADYINNHFQVQQPFTSDTVVAALEAGDFPSTPTYDQASSKVYLSTAYAGSIQAARFNDISGNYVASVDRIEAQSSFDAMDVAIIHVSGMDNMPSIQLSDSNQVAILDNLTVIGFPGLADVSTNPTNLLTSSANKVYVSALKTTDNGIPVLEVGGNIEHGDSGGPALDDNGNIVGVVSFGINDPGETGETSFLQVANSARSLIQSQGINTTPGPLQKAWEQAVNDYSSSQAGHWHKAEQDLSDLVSTYKGFQGAVPYLNYARQQAANEQGTSSSALNSSIPWLAIILVILLAVVIAIVVIIVLARGRTQQTLAPAGMGNASRPAPGPYGNYPPVPNSQPVYTGAPEGYGATSWYEQSTGQMPRYQAMQHPPQTPLPSIPVTPNPLGAVPGEFGQGLPMGSGVPQTPSYEQLPTQATNGYNNYQPSPWNQSLPAAGSAVPYVQGSPTYTPEQIQPSNDVTVRSISSPDYAQVPPQMPDTSAASDPLQQQESAASTPEPAQLSDDVTVRSAASPNDDQTSPQIASAPVSDINQQQENPISPSAPLQSADEATTRLTSSPEQSYQLPNQTPDSSASDTVQYRQRQESTGNPPVSTQNSYGYEDSPRLNNVQAPTQSRSQDILRQLAGIWDDEPTATAAPAPGRSFSVPRRPSVTTAENGPEVTRLSTDTYAGLHVMMAPCGHINTPDVRFCRLCGQPVQMVQNEETTDTP